MELDDVLNGVTCDLVSESRFTPFLRQLFSQPPGHWVQLSVTPCAQEASKTYGELPDSIWRGVFASWLPSPYDHDDAYSLIYFFASTTDTLFFNSAYFNRRSLGNHEVG